jgi:3-hydroxybutyryl-CoA dehydrogenase
MQLVVRADDILKQELLSNGQTADVDIVWIQTAEQFRDYRNAAIYCDLLFDSSDDRMSILGNISQPVIINSVDKTLESLQVPFIRINGWPGFLRRSIVEASCPDNDKMNNAEIFFSVFNRKIEWLPDEPGFVAARIVAMIINEAYFALGEGVSTKEEIDVAMKLGTNYPYGPFEWCDRIGIKKIYSLLAELTKVSSRYKPAIVLEKEVSS